MRISVKGRYALAAITEMARDFGSGRQYTVIALANRLGISKIYLEQVFSQARKGGILLSIKGAKGGYQLSRHPRGITAWDVLSCIENALTEHSGESVEKEAPELEAALNDLVFTPLDNAILQALSKVNIQELAEYADNQGENQSFMYFL